MTYFTINFTTKGLSCESEPSCLKTSKSKRWSSENCLMTVRRSSVNLDPVLED